MKYFYFKKQLILLAVSIFFSSFGYSQIQSYYNDVNLTLTGTALRDELATKIISTHTKFLSYDGAREALKIVDLDPGQSTYVLLLYGFSNNTCPSSTGDDNDHRLRDKNSFGGSASCEWNREHTYAKSLGSPNLGTSGPGSDAHHLRACDVQRNSSRSSLKFASGSGNSGASGGGWYPGDEWKGDVARMMMYMYLRYGSQCYPTGVAIGNTNSIDPKMIDLLLDWNAQDPVSKYEDVRNTYLSNTSNQYGQGNRNPFIDNPNLATQIWGGTAAEDRWNTTPDTEVPTAPTLLVASNVTNTTVDLNWVASTDDTAVVSYAIFVNGSVYSTSTTNSTTLVGLTLNTLYTITVYAKDAAGNSSEVSNTETITTTNIIDTEAPTAPINLVSSGTTQTQTLLTWSPSTDNIGVIEYQIFSGTTQIGTTSSISYLVPSLIANTSYTFTVKAVDAAGNISLVSNQETITTLENPAPAGPSIIFQGFEASANDTWNYSISPISCNDSDNDVWAVVSSVGSISTAKTDTHFFGVKDLEGNCGTSAGGTISFNAVDISSYIDVNLSFAMNVDGFDVSNGDIITYEVFYDNVSQGIVTLTEGSPYSTTGWEEISVVVPNSVSFVRFDIYVKQNGGTDYAGFDDVQLKGTAIVEAPSIIINEVDADTPGTDALEFVELYDGGVGNTSLDGLVLVLFNGSDHLSYNEAIDLDGYTTNEEGYFVIGSASVINVDLVAFTTNGIQNGADAVALYNGDAVNFPNDTPILVDDTLLDAIVYDTNDSDNAGLLVLLNPDEPQINEDELDNKDVHSLQRVPNGSGGSRNTLTYVQEFPTPGTENHPPVVLPETITILEARSSDRIGELVTVSGILTVSDQFSGSAYLQDETGAIAIFDALVYGDGVFEIGDSITVSGTRSLYNDQVQISNVISVENTGMPNNPIIPLNITLNELENHPAELVSIANPNFPKPGDILFGNTNYLLTDNSGSGSLRIDGDVDEIVGLGQPESCSELIGVVGRFYQIFQLLPRLGSDMACASAFEQTGNDLIVSKDNTFDVVTWNLEWFGDEANSPASGNLDSDQVQKEHVKNAIQQLNADIYAVEEVSDDVLFGQMVSEIPGYSYVLSDATSYPNDTEGTKQKLGFIYKTATVDVIDSKALLKSIHPYYNGGDDSALTDYPAEKSRFFASGRLPFMLTANVTIGDKTQLINIIGLHARANRSTGAQDRYDMRKYDVEVLKDSLDAYYPNANVILLGDYNDDVDETVSNVSTTISSYESYINDTNNYTAVTKSLSDGGYRSYVTYENMIDHIIISNELSEEYIDNSSRVHYEFYTNDYTSTTSDHFPVSARFLLSPLAIDNSSFTNVSCVGNDGTASITVSGGILPYTYEWTGSESTTNTSSDLNEGAYSVTITDALGSSVTKEFIIVEALDEINPIVITQDITVQLDINGEVTITPEQIDNASTDACGVDTYSLNITNFSCENIGDNEVTLTITDVNGNSESAIATVTVEDKIAPVVYTQNITVQLDANGEVTITPEQIDNASNDTCGIDTYSLDITDFSCETIGENEVTLTVTDVNENSTSKNAIVTVIGAGCNVTNDITFPEGFSPNGDGIRDTYIITGLEQHRDNIFEVYNRWGNKVYSSQFYQNDWDGISNGSSVFSKNKKLPVGPYFYVLTTGYNTVYKGWIYINY